MIEIISAQKTTEEPILWSCWLQITQDSKSWMLPATAPGMLAEGELQAYFEAREDELWQIAQQKQYPVDLFACIGLDELMRAFALVVLDEVNLLRARAGLPERTAAQLVEAIKGRLT